MKTFDIKLGGRVRIANGDWLDVVEEDVSHITGRTHEQKELGVHYNGKFRMLGNAEALISMAGFVTDYKRPVVRFDANLRQGTAFKTPNGRVMWFMCYHTPPGDIKAHVSHLFTNNIHFPTRESLEWHMVQGLERFPEKDYFG